MSYIDDEFKIKSTKSMEKHITTITAIEVMCIKMSDVVRVIWAVDNKLNHFDIKASVIYVIKVEELQEAIDAVIVDKTFTVLPSGKVMVCEVTLVNGFTVRGEASVISKANFRQEIGEEISFINARSKIWELEGYLLQSKLAEV